MVHGSLGSGSAHADLLKPLGIRSEAGDLALLVDAEQEDGVGITLLVDVHLPLLVLVDGPVLVIVVLLEELGHNLPEVIDQPACDTTTNGAVWIDTHGDLNTSPLVEPDKLLGLEGGQGVLLGQRC